MNKALPIIIIVLSLLTSACSSKYNDFLEKGNAALEEQNYLQATVYFESAIEEKSTKEAKQLLEEAKSKLKVENLLEEGKKALESKDYLKAVEYLKSVVKETNSEEANEFLMEANKQLELQNWMNAGINALESNNYPLAVEHFEKVFKANPNYTDLKKLLAESKDKLAIQLLLEEGKNKLKEKQFDNAISIFNDIIGKETQVKELVEDAKSSLKEAKILKEEHLLTLANTALKEADYKLATEHLSKAFDLNPENKETEQLLNYSERMSSGIQAYNDEDYVAADFYFTFALEAKPNDEEAIRLQTEANSRALANSEVIEEENYYYEEEDYATIEFVNTMDYLINYMMENVANHIPSIAKGLTTPGYLISHVGSIYRESVNVYVPYTEYQHIMDNWLIFLEKLRDAINATAEASKGNFKNFGDTEYIEYMRLVQDGLNEIRY